MISPILKPGSTIGILGGGQLGRMTALAAARLGYNCLIYDPASNSPAAQVARHIQADFHDQQALETFANEVDVVTIEFENLPVNALEFLQRYKPVRPGPKILAIAQNRIAEKTFFNQIGIKTAAWRPVNSLATLQQAMVEIGTPALLKTATMGYDGKGQFHIKSPEAAESAFAFLQGKEAILEAFVPFSMEIAVTAARTHDGRVAIYSPVQNHHKNNILDRTIVPAPGGPALHQKAMLLAENAISALALEGILTLEMFVLKNGDLRVNEMAPRPHNSAHWTQDGCMCSQFEQLVRVLANLPLGLTTRTHDVIMQNLLGDAVHQWQEILQEPNAILHLYGKDSIKQGRKMGHVNRLLRQVKA